MPGVRYIITDAPPPVGDLTVAELISTDAENSLMLGTDDKLLVPRGLLTPEQLASLAKADTAVQPSAIAMLCGAVGGGACDRKWAGGGSVQELNWEAIEADVGRVESRET